MADKSSVKVGGLTIPLEPRTEKLFERASAVAFGIENGQCKELGARHLFMATLYYDSDMIRCFFLALGGEKVYNETQVVVRKFVEENHVPTLKNDEEGAHCISCACEVAKDTDSESLSVEHVFIAIVLGAVNTFSPMKVFEKKMSYSPETFAAIKALFLDCLRTGNEIEDYLDKVPVNNGGTDIVITSGEDNQKIPFCTNLNYLAAQGGFEPAKNRETEIEKMSHILSRKYKKNPILVGKAGVGKTTIVQTLAYNILSHQCFEVIAPKTIFSLDLAAMVAGTVLRGQFEERLKRVIDIFSQNPDWVLFIDEIHTILKAGDHDGATDAANILKPYLANGKLSIIGATTEDEYKIIESDKALKRRFDVVQVKEPNAAETFEILKKSKESYESFHQANVSDAAIQKIVDLTSRYIHNNNFPDKAFDLLDYVCAFVKNQGLVRPEKISKTEERITRASHLAKDTEHFKEIAHKHLVKYEKQQRDWYKKKNSTVFTITEQDVIKSFVARTGIAISTSKTPIERHDEIAQYLKTRVFGQNEAVDSVIKGCANFFIGVNPVSRPISSFLFVGPSRTGKTHLAKTLAESPMFGGNDSFIDLNMTEYSDSSAMMKLIGSPPGFVDHKVGSSLLNKVKNNPQSVVLFDEIEKAHPDAWDVLLQILDKGEVKDARGDIVSFRNTVIIMTGNVGTTNEKKLPFGFNQTTEDVSALKTSEEVKKRFRPEMLNRIDKIVVFKPIAAEDGEKIISGYLEEAVSSYKNSGYSITLPESFAAKIYAKFCKDDNAFVLAKKYVQDEVIGGISSFLLTSGLKACKIQYSEQGQLDVFSTKNSQATIRTPAHAKA